MSLITAILNVDLAARYTIRDITAHPWFTAGDAYAPEGGATDRSIAWELAPELAAVPSIESVEFEFDSDDGEWSYSAWLESRCSCRLGPTQCDDSSLTLR
jgi:hypothetical protein